MVLCFKWKNKKTPILRDNATGLRIGRLALDFVT